MVSNERKLCSEIVLIFIVFVDLIIYYYINKQTKSIYANVEPERANLPLTDKISTLYKEISLRVDLNN